MMVGRIVVLGALAVAAWLGALGLFSVYVNWFSEGVKSGDWAVLGLAWFAVLVGVAATFALVATLVYAVADRRLRG